jgi:hypothetical protein
MGNNAYGWLPPAKRAERVVETPAVVVEKPKVQKPVKQKEEPKTPAEEV